MSAKGFVILTFATFLLMALGALIFVFTGSNWNGGNQGAFWMLAGGSVFYFLGFLIFNRKWSPAKSTVQYLRAVDSGITLETGLQLFKTYSYFLLVGSLLFLCAAAAAIIVY